MMKRKKGEITHMTLQEYITLNRLPEPDIMQATALKVAAEQLCNEKHRLVMHQEGSKTRHGLKVPMFPPDILETVCLTLFNKKHNETKK